MYEIGSGRPTFFDARRWATEDLEIKGDPYRNRGEVHWTEDDGTSVLFYVTGTFFWSGISVVKPNGAKASEALIRDTPEYFAELIERCKETAVTQKQAEYRNRLRIKKLQTAKRKHDERLARANYVLARYSFNYADEFDIQGFKVFTGTEWQEELRLIESAIYPVESGFGTNEFVEFNSAKGFLDSIDTSAISKQDYETLRKLFPGGHVGAPNPWPRFDDNQPHAEQTE